MANLSYKATLVVRGDLDVSIGRNISVNVLNVNGEQHHSSGIYTIMSIEDCIESDFTTTMILQKKSDSSVSVTTTISGNTSEDGSTVSSGEVDETGLSTVDYSGSTTQYEKGECLGKYKLTAYCPCKICCGNYSYEVTGKPNKTASGTTPSQGRTIAADWSVLPKGTKVMINDHVYTVEDVGGAIDGNHIDIYYEKHADAKAFGVQYAYVYKVKKAVSVNRTSSVPSDVPDSISLQACMKYLGVPYVYGGESMAEVLS